MIGALAATGSWVVASRPDGRLQVTVLSTGSSTSVLIGTPDGSVVLVDGGASPALLLTALGRVLPPASTHIDMVVLTGGEQAAVNGLSGLPGHFTVGTVVTPGDLTPAGDAILAALEGAGANVLDAGGGAWTFGGSEWRCLGFVGLSAARTMCVLTVHDSTGRALVLGDAGTADQDGLCAVYSGALGTDLVVAPPGGALSPALLATAHPLEVAVPGAQGAAAAPAPSGYATDRTSVDGDLSYKGGPGGHLERA